MSNNPSISAIRPTGLEINRRPDHNSSQSRVTPKEETRVTTQTTNKPTPSTRAYA